MRKSKQIFVKEFDHGKCMKILMVFPTTMQ